MVQQSAAKSTKSEKVAMPESSRQQKTGWNKGVTYSQYRQQQPKNRQQVKIQTIDNLISPRASSSSSFTEVGARVPRSPASRTIDLPPRTPSRNYGTLTQPEPYAGDVLDDELRGRKTAPPATARKRSASAPRARRKPSLLLYALRLLILGVGVSAIAGTILSVLDPTTRMGAENPQTAIALETPPEVELSANIPASGLKLEQEMMPLKTAVQQLVAKNTKLFPGIFLVDLDTGAYLDIQGDTPFAAASTIKFPVLVAFFQDVDAGKIRLDEQLTLKQEQIGGGSGEMQYKAPGTKFTALEVATKMIVISDNTATNVLIDRLGGIAALNQRFQSWGLQTTQLRNPLPDLPGTNTTSPKELGQLMAMVNQGELMSLKSRDRLLDIMRRTRTATLLPRGLGAGATIAHKTGDIGSMVGDVGLIDLPSGKRYIAVVMVKRPHNDNRAQELIRQVSRAAYQQFSQPSVSEVMPSTPFVSSAPVGGAEEQVNR